MSSRVCSVFVKLAVLAIFVITAGATGCSSNGSGGTTVNTGKTTGTAGGTGRGMTGGTTGGAAGTVISATSAGGQLAAAPDAGGAGGSDGAATSLPDAPIAIGGSGGSTGMGGGGAVADAAADQNATASAPDAPAGGGSGDTGGTGGVGGREAGGEGGSSGIAGAGGAAGAGGRGGGSAVDAGADRGADIPAVSDGVPPAGGVDADANPDEAILEGVVVPTGSMTVKRSAHTATLLPSGEVLVAGGLGNGGYLRSAELYDPVAGTFTATGSMTTARTNHTATLLPNGKVLITGGLSEVNTVGSAPVASAEVYDPATRTFTATGSMTVARQLHTATLLPSDKVLVAGGDDESDPPANSEGTLGSAEVYDPAAGTFIPTGNMTAAREAHTATLLSNGAVLIAGGLTEVPSSVDGGASVMDVLRSAELYNPASGTFTATGNMMGWRHLHTATLLQSGKVLLAGGDLASAELYNPAAGTFTPTGNMTVATRAALTATLLLSGQVLIAGGFGYNNPASPDTLSSAEVYDPTAGTFTATGSMAVARAWATATLLSNGAVLIAGGDNNVPVDGGFSNSLLASAELLE